MIELHEWTLFTGNGVSMVVNYDCGDGMSKEKWSILNYLSILNFLSIFWNILLCLLCVEGILRIPGEGVIGADRGGTGILPLRIHLVYQCILGKCLDTTLIITLINW